MDSNINKENSKKGLFVQAGILAIAGVISRIIGLLYRSPLTAIIGDEGNGYYSTAYNFYGIVLLISSYSIPSAISKILSGKIAVKEYRNAHRIFRCALIYVAIVGLLGGLLLFFGADFLVVGRSATVLRFFAPTIFFFGFLGVLRGYFQAHRTMVPTSISQLVEQICNAIVSIVGAVILTGMVGEGDTSKRAVYGAIGSALGTGSGVLIALIFMFVVYRLNSRNIHRMIEDDAHEDISYKGAFKLILTVVTPFILSTFIYNVSTTLNSTLFTRILINVKGMEDSAVAYLYGIFSSKAMVITNLPIALASAAAAAMIPEISATLARDGLDVATKTISRVTRVILMISIPCSVGLFALAKPVMMILFPQKESLDEASLLLMSLAITVVFYSLSTVTNAVLQGIGKIYVPVVNAFVSLIIQGVILAVLLLFTNLNDIALCIVTIAYSFMMCILNNFFMKKSLEFTVDVKKTYILPAISAAVMGAIAFGVHFVFSLVFGKFVSSWYFTNLFATIIAVVIAIIVYFVVLIRSGGASEDDIRRFPKGATIVRLLKRVKIF